jgi:hypothetical protein
VKSKAHGRQSSGKSQYESGSSLRKGGGGKSKKRRKGDEVVPEQGNAGESPLRAPVQSRSQTPMNGLDESAYVRLDGRRPNTTMSDVHFEESGF